MVKTHKMASTESSVTNLNQESSDSFESDFSIVTNPNESNVGIGDGNFNNFSESQLNLSLANGGLSYEDLQCCVLPICLENYKLKETIRKNHEAMESQFDTMVKTKEHIELMVKDQMDKKEQAKMCIEELRLENSTLKSAMASVQEDKIAYESQIKDLKSVNENNEILYHQLKADNDELLADYNQLKLSYDSAMSEKNMILADYVDLKHKLEDIERSKGVFSAGTSFQLLSKIDFEPPNSKSDLKKSGTSASAEQIDCFSESGEYDENTRLSLQSAEKSIKHLLTELSTEHGKANELQSQLSSEKTKNESLKKLVSEQKDMIDRLSQQSSKNDKEVENNAQFSVASSYIQKYKERCDSLETWLNVYQGKLDTIQDEGSDVIIQLREEVQNLRKTLEDEKQRSEGDKKQLVEERLKHATLMEEHQQLKNTWETMFHDDHSQSSQTEAYYCLQLKAFQEREDLIHAKLVLLEEKLKSKDDELEASHSEILKLKSELENLPLLQTQLEVYKADFQEEHQARELVNDQKASLVAELNRLRAERGGQSPNTIRMHEVEGWTIAEETPENVGENADEHSAAEGGANNGDVEAYTCPKCNFVFDSFQPLLNHVNNCLDNE